MEKPVGREMVKADGFRVCFGSADYRLADGLDTGAQGKQDSNVIN